MGHKNSDLDSFGASLGVSKIAQAYGKKAKIIVDFDSIESKTKDVALMVKGDSRYEGMIVSSNEVLEYATKNTLLIIVDNHKPGLVISQLLLERVRNKVIIDHHRRGEEFIEAPVLTYLEPAASSTVELLVELCEYQKTPVKFTELDATIMYAGMLVDVSRAYEFLEDSYEVTLYKMLLASSAYRYTDSILISVGSEEDEYTREMLAKSSNALLEISGVKAAFTIGKVSRDVVAVSARSYKKINVQVIMENIGGGGHFSMAACQFEDKTLEEVRDIVEEAISQYLKDRGE